MDELMVAPEELEKRIKDVRETLKKTKCEIDECNDLIDMTDHFINTTCTYHKHLFNWWVFIMDWKHLTENKGKGVPLYEKNRKYRRQAFIEWMREMGKEKCDKIVAKVIANIKSWER